MPTTFNFEPSGALPDEIKEVYGKPFGFFTLLKMGGTGSPKAIYKGGVAAFDALDTLDEVSISYCSFEFIERAFVIRLQKGTRKKGWICFWDEIQNIYLSKLITTDKHINTKGQLDTNEYQHGKLTLQFKRIPPIEFDVRGLEFPDMLKYFKKSIFDDIIVYQTS